MAYVSGLFSGLKYTAGLVNNDSQVQQILDLLNAFIDANKVDSIVSLFMMPTQYYTSDTTPVVKHISLNCATTVDGYTPRNKKLLTYPFVFLAVDSLNESKTYRYEWSNMPLNNGNRVISFSIVGCVSPNPEIVCMPRSYNGSDTRQPVGGVSVATNPTESVTMTGFPQCAFSIDAYRAWLAQKSVTFGLNTAAQAGSAMIGLSAGNALGAVGLASSISSMIYEVTSGAKARGTQGSSAEVAFREKDFYFKRMSITAEYARMIDDYFTAYGYAIDEVGVPSRRNRTRFTYVKTRECNVHGELPSDDAKFIADCYNRGIRFWSDVNNVGNYQLANNVL